MVSAVAFILFSPSQFFTQTQSIHCPLNYNFMDLPSPPRRVDMLDDLVAPEHTLTMPKSPHQLPLRFHSLLAHPFVCKLQFANLNLQVYEISFFFSNIFWFTITCLPYSLYSIKVIFFSSFLLFFFFIFYSV